MAGERVISKIVSLIILAVILHFAAPGEGTGLQDHCRIDHGRIEAQPGMRARQRCGGIPIAAGKQQGIDRPGQFDAEGSRAIGRREQRIVLPRCRGGSRHRDFAVEWNHARQGRTQIVIVVVGFGGELALCEQCRGGPRHRRVEGEGHLIIEGVDPIAIERPGVAKVHAPGRAHIAGAEVHVDRTVIDGLDRFEDAAIGGKRVIEEEGPAEGARAFAFFIGQIQVTGPAAIEEVIEVQPFLGALHLQALLGLRSGYSSHLCGSAGARRQPALQRQRVGAHAVPDRLRVVAHDVGQHAGEQIHAPTAVTSCPQFVELVVRT